MKRLIGEGEVTRNLKDTFRGREREMRNREEARETANRLSVDEPGHATLSLRWSPTVCEYAGHSGVALLSNFRETRVCRGIKSICVCQDYL